MCGPEISLAIRCPGCGKAGKALWREGREQSAAIRCELVELSAGFRQNGRDGASGDTQIVCEGCGAVVPG